MNTLTTDDLHEARRFYSAVYGILAAWLFVAVVVVVEVCK